MLYEESRPKAPRPVVPCRVNQAPHKYGPWREIVTGTGRLVSRTCNECGREDRNDDAD